MKKYTVRNKLVMKTMILKVGTIMNLLRDGNLISIPQFLQRTLLKEKWFKNHYKNSKQYVASVYKGQGQLDSITIIPIELLIMKVEKTIIKEKNTNVKNSLQKGLDILINYKNNGATDINLDGQSRLILGIEEYTLKNSFPLGDEAKSIILDVESDDDDTIESADLTHKKFNELDTNLQNLFKEQKMVVNVIEDFYDFDDIIDALVNKQKGFGWRVFQQIKQKFRFTEFVVNMVESSKTTLGELYQKYWQENMHSGMKADYRTDVDGHQLFSIIGGYLTEKGSYPSDSDAINQLSSNEPIKNASIETFMKLVTTKFFNFIGETKVRLPELVNFLVFKMILDNGTKLGKTPFTKEIRIPINKDVIILNPKELVDEFFLLHKKLISKVGENGVGAHEASWYNKDGKSLTLRMDGYKNYLTLQNNQYIKARMILFFKYLNWNDLVDKKIIRLVDDNSQKSFDEVLVYRGGKDLDGKSIPVAEYRNHDGSHGDSTKEGGSNEFPNLVLEKFSINRSRGSKKLEIINPKPEKDKKNDE